MCEYVSWIEYDKEILFLTDEDVFSSFGRRRLEGTRDNDIIGHGAIRAFFNLLRGAGTDKEVQDFWNLEKLPKEIAEKLKTPEDFDRNFGRMFEKFFQDDDLMFILQNAPDAYKERACEQLLKRTLSDDELRDIIRFAPDAYKKKLEKLLREKSGGYMPGDKVRITKNPIHPNDTPCWVFSMDRFKGKILTLKTSRGKGKWKTEETTYIFHIRWFEPVKKEK